MLADGSASYTVEFTKSEFAAFCKDEEIVFSERMSLNSPIRKSIF